MTQLIVIILCLILVPLWCNSIKITMQPNMILFPLYKLLTITKDTGGIQVYVLPNWVRKPLFDCAYCMPSVHGLIVYLIVICCFPVKHTIWAYIIISIPSVLSSGLLREWIESKSWIKTVIK